MVANHESRITGRKSPRARPSGKVVEKVMRSLARAITGLELPAVEKISEEQAEEPFQILIATLLSARTQDATTHAASTRLFRVARTPHTRNSRVEAAWVVASCVRDRKSTRLNSSHGYISYAVFCLKQKNRLSSVVINTTLGPAFYVRGIVHGFCVYHPSCASSMQLYFHAAASLVDPTHRPDCHRLH